MKIAIDLTPLADNFTGVERFAANIAEQLLIWDDINEYILFFKESVPKRFRNLYKKKNVEYVVLQRKKKLWFYQFTLWKAMQRTYADKFLFLAFPSPYFLKKEGIINTIHDLGCWDCPKCMPLKMVAYFRAMYRRASKVSEKIITVSEFSKKRIEDVLGVPDGKIEVVYNGVDNSLKREKISKQEASKIMQKYGIEQDSYILSLATLEPRKNIELLLEAYRELLKTNEDIPDLVLAGRVGWKTRRIIEEKLLLSNTQKVLFTGYIEEKDLPIIYSQADLFVFPSKYEGFGLPILEALFMGAKVLVSNISVFKELFFPYVSFFENENSEDLKKNIILCLKEGKNKDQRKTGYIEKIYDYEKEAYKVFKLLNN